MLDEKEMGQIFIYVEDQRQVWKSQFEYHCNVQVIHFENEEKILLLRPGENEVSLHVCKHTLHRFALTLCVDPQAAQFVICSCFFFGSKTA